LPAWWNALERQPSWALRLTRICCGFARANKGHDTRALQAYLGHKNIQHAVRYTELAPTRFKDFWR
jgi:type 1 fimbriae regulatory protein FimB/type 1 fimbriae regulatory protein FimE